LEELVLSCLSRDPGRRPASAAELKKKLVAHLEGVRVASDSILGMKSPSQTEVLSERLLRRRTRMGMALGACTAIAIAVVGMYFIHWPFSRPRRTTIAEKAPVIAPAPLPAEPAPPSPPAQPAAEPETAQLPSLAPPAKPVVAAKAKPSAAPAEAPATRPVKAATKESKAATPLHREADAKAGRKTEASKATAEPETAGGGEATKEDDSSTPSADEVVAAVSKAEAAFSEGRMATARVAASQAVAGARKAPPALRLRAFVILGKVQLASQQFGEAERSFDKALAIDPQDPVAQKGKERARESAKAEP
jgi:tetratricopeptide (TPR) repeat protein